MTEQKLRELAEKLTSLPPSVQLVELALVALGASTVSSGNINELRSLCHEIADLITENYYKRNFSEIVSKYRSRSLKDERTFQRLVTDLSNKAPEFVVSMRNSRVGIGGSANEVLYQKVLESAGLVFDEDFKKVSGRGKDFEVFGPSRQNLLIEVKSLKVRERSARTGSDRGLKVVLAGFFDDPSEFSLDQVGEMAQVFEAVYLPLQTLRKVAKESRGVKNSHGIPLLRNNKKFPAEMVRFHKTGSLP